MNMKICMVGLGIGKIHGAFVGGHVNNVINLSKALAKKGFQVHIVTTPPIYSKDFENIPELQEGVTLHYVNKSSTASVETSKRGRLSLSYSFKSCLKIVSAIKKLHKKEKFDVIHGHSGFPFVAIIPEYFKMFKGIPSIHTLYCPISENWVNRQASAFCLSKLNLVIALSNNVKKSLSNIVPQGLIRVIPPLIDLSRFNNSFESKSEKPASNSRNLLYLGNLSKTKGLHILLEALKIIKRDVQNIKLLLGLDLPLYEVRNKNLEIIEKIEALGLAEDVVFLGIIRNLPKVMMESDIFVAPFTSTYGPADYPLSILEAMASGLPIVATNVGGIPEIVKNGENGLLVEPNNPCELAQAISYLIENVGVRRKLGREGNRFIIELSKDAVRKHEMIYKEIADS